MFTTDYTRVEKREFVEGDYPVRVESFEFKTWNYGDTELQRIDIRLRIIGEDFNNWMLFDSIFERVEEGSDFATWDFVKMNRYSKALMIEEGMNFDSIEQWLEYIIDLKMVAKVKIVKGYNRVVAVKEFDGLDLE